ncbi:MAG: dodecin family protein [Gammaproteobacteria bacterium]
MSVARVTEITAESKLGFDDAIKMAIERAHKTLHYVRSAWIADQEVTVRDGKIEDYRVRLKVTFVLKD